MFRYPRKRALLVAVSVLALALSIAACGGGSSSSTSGQTSGQGDETNVKANETAAGSSNDLAASEAALAPYTGQPSPFPVTEKLKEIPTGAKVYWMDCGDPTCALFYELLSGAAKTMGIDLDILKAGQTASTVSAAFDSVIALKPDGVIVGAIEPELYAPQLKELQEMGIPVVTSAVTDAEEFGIKGVTYGKKQVEIAGELMADFTAVEYGPDADVVYYGTPELGFNPTMEATLEEKLAEVCPDCSLRTVPILASEVGNTAPSTMVSDLQANPDTDVVLSPAGQTYSGLPAALQAAGIDVKTVSSTPTPTNLQYLKEDKETAALGVDLPVMTWTIIDSIAREIIGQELKGLEAEGLTVMQFLKPEDITFDPSKGWTGYPDFAERFMKLWGIKG